MRLVSFCLILLFLDAFSLLSQNVNRNNLFEYEREKDRYAPKNQEHTAFKSNFSMENGGDSILKLEFIPAISSNFGFQNEGSLLRNGVGGIVRSSYKKWSVEVAYMHHYGQYMKYQEDFINERRVVPSMNVARGNNNIQSDFIQGNLNYQLNSIFNFQLGYGRNFIGDGYRSLLLSDFANSSPYARIDAKFWRFKYTSLYSMHENIYNVAGKPNLYQRKYSVTHFLDYRISKWLSVGLFESIVWQAQEDGYKRGFEVNYLNPVIFYRPVEFSIGSSDNALVGANLKATIKKTHIVYGQILFDEFLLSEIRADFNQWRNPNENIRSGWWANKYGIQMGWRGFDLFNVEGLNSRLEYNSVRPYTYAHSNPTQAYSNYNLALAHPLGANFHEVVFISNYQYKRYNVRLQLNQSRKGTSPLGTNFGENLELTNISREREFENSLGQGVPVNVFIVNPEISYLIKKEWNLTASIGLLARQENATAKQHDSYMIYFSLNTQLFNQYFDF